MPERAGLIAELVKAAAEREPQARQAFLDRECPADPELRAEVESLLKHQAQVSRFIETPALHLAAETLVQAGAFGAGQNVGHYEIVSLIGKGGMGEVYLAQDQKLRRRVALKLVRRGMDTEAIVRRFQHEQQLLAGLNHPNIAQLYDSGITPDGIPFFAMEYVDGTRVDDYCREKELAIEARLELFGKVCGAVHYAHQHLVVHRDIKPSNILVTTDGEPKLLDFGIAKLLDTVTNAAADQTVTLQNVMTPEYASPEHVRGETITTASDVYSLGVLLYELLTGSKPYRIETRTPVEIARIITEREPERPSTSVTKAGNSPQFDSRSAKFLRGDLDNIVLMALRKEPSRRYASVAQFGADIHRHLAALPVIARKDTLAYRSSKFVARHRVSVAAAVLIILTLIGAVIVTSWQARVARSQRDRARAEAVRAERIKTFLQDILAVASPLAKGPEVKVIAALDDATKRVETELANEPEVLIDVQNTIGYTYYRLSRVTSAETVLRSAVDRAVRVLGESHPLTAMSRTFLALSLETRGDLATAEPMVRQALEAQRALYPQGHRDMFRTLHTLGETLLRKSDKVNAESALQEAAEMCKRFIGEDSVEMIDVINSLGRVREVSGDFSAAEVLYHQAINRARRLPQGNSIVTLPLINLGRCLTAKGDYDAAAEKLEEGLRLARGQWSENSYPEGVALGLLGQIQLVKANYEKSIESSLGALRILRSVVAQTDADLINALTTLSVALSRTGRAVEGESYARESVASTPPIPSLVGTAKGALGECLAAQKRYSEAEPFLLESLDALQKAKWKSALLAWARQAARERLVAFYENVGKPDEANKYRSAPGQ